ncbi:MAG: type II toxin-antitoxin system VapC family toxin [Dysgonamonadaceae bacterium]|jgi:predicted nucleic acid-binding protein|nr:type II toxin-antitoxin system VapC family toxin [Dysgonamonadaceae bacterium]
MGQRYLLDTNAVLDFMGNKLPSKAHNLLSDIIDTEINLSVITKMELLGFSKVEQELASFVDCADVLMIDENVTDKTIEIRKRYRIKLPDAVIAATALVHNMTLLTRNIRDFKSIKGLTVLNLWEEMP